MMKKQKRMRVKCNGRKGDKEGEGKGKREELGMAGMVILSFHEGVYEPIT